jgi:hypothetical protein
MCHLTQKKQKVKALFFLSLLFVQQQKAAKNACHLKVMILKAIIFLIRTFYHRRKKYQKGLG